ncbi:AsmA-like C-terminal region-containing protein [Rhodonellum sp.]|uniref:AsmA-like C-terminal region-containing protein n=1 Tax=Rhodonellum sp. TaxID=2231180 RepID=UPI00271C5711|nr:AsmA-like C-terminal region-containing protein [Rhodonellum sp.]MDO9554446.1 AsmA-like C-terminal region-containing protein [Rhodonellum sp.]
MKRKKIFYLSLLVLIPLMLGISSIWILYQNQNQLTQKAITAINEQFVGELTIEDSYISPFANFPYISIDLKGIKFYESKDNQSKPIYEAEDFYVGFNIWDIIRGNYSVKKLKISNGHLHVVKYENGDINLLLAKGISEEKDATETEEALVFDLAGIVIEKFDITYSDLAQKSDFVFHIGSLQSDFRFREDHIFIDLLSDLVFDYEQDGAPTFFADKKIHLDLELDYFEKLQQVIISPSMLKLEEAILALSGEIKILEEGIGLDLKINGEKPDFNIFAAFAPKEVGEILSRYKNEGEVYFLGSVKGIAGKEESPAISVEFGANNAYFLNPAIDKKVDALHFSGFYTNGKDRNLKTSEIQLQNFSARPDQGTFQGRLIVRDFEDPFIKVNLNADLDLGFLGEFFEVEGLQGITGQVILNMDFDEMIDMDLASSGLATVQESLQSEIFLKDLSFSVPGLEKAVTQANGYAFMKHGKLVLDALSFKMGNSDFAFSGELDDFPVLLHGNNLPLKASFTVKSKQIDLGQLIPSDSAGAKMEEVISDFEIKMAFETTGYDLHHYEYLPKGEFFIEDFYAKLKHYPHVFHDFDVDLLIDENTIEIKDFRGEIDKSDFLFTGKINNYRKWFQEEKVGKSSLEFDLVSNQLKINDLLRYDGVNYLPEDYREEVFSELKLKGKVDLNFQGGFHSADLHLKALEGKMKIHPLKLENFQGKLHYENDYLTLDSLSGKMGTSDFRLMLGYFMGEKDTLTSKRNYLHLKAKTLDLDALMGFDRFETDTNHQDAFNVFELPFSNMDFSLEIGKMNYHTFWLEDVFAKARTTTDHYLYLDTLGLSAADGTLGVSGYFNGSNPDEIYFHSTMKAKKLDLDKLLIKFENFGQDYLINENLHGLVSGTITSKFLVYPDLTPIIEKSDAKMDLTIYQGSIVNFAPMDAMSDYFSDRNLKNIRFDTLSNTLDLKGGVLSIPKMTINSSLGFIELSGKQSLDLNMDYFIRVPLAMVTQVGFRSLFGGKNKNEIDPEQEDAIVYRDTDRRIRFVNINMKGTPDDYKISLKRDKD